MASTGSYLIGGNTKVPEALRVVEPVECPNYTNLSQRSSANKKVAQIAPLQKQRTANVMLPCTASPYQCPTL